jgi:lysine 2,3-aminomutase
MRPQNTKSVSHAEMLPWAGVSETEWSDWRWQLRNAVRSIEELRNIVGDSPLLSIDDCEMIEQVSGAFEMKLTPHTVLNIHRAIQFDDKAGVDALIATFVPTMDESGRLPKDVIDGIGEEEKTTKPAPLVTNFYKDRVLLFAGNMCASYCRFCFRRRKVGDKLEEEIERGTDPEVLKEAINYIRSDSRVREVVISGGDPLTLSDDRLLSLLEQLKAIEHVKLLRLDTKVLTALPQRITPSLAQTLARFKPLYVTGNFLHSVELTPETIAACNTLTDAGIPVASHTALLKGINDNPDVIAELMWGLFENRVIPYYLIHFIPTKWTEHFRVPISKGLEIMRHLHGRLSGLANPTYIIYLPDGAGKVPLLPNYITKRAREGYYLQNFEGRVVLYEEPPDL